MPDTPPEHAPQHAAHLVLLAYQSGLIDRPTFDAVLDAWHADRSRSVPDLLAELGRVSPESLTFLDALARRHAQDLGGTAHALSALAANAGSSTVEELATRVPEFAETFATRNSSLTIVCDTPGQSALSGAPRSGGVRYKAIRFHAKGGLGAVFVAQDEELNRKVALKEIQPRYADRTAERDRFLVEAEITGRLEHPGIVPVYGLGTYADGRPFYAMRFIHGESLETACRAYHSDTARDPSARSVALRGLLRRFLDVCNAVEYAHSRGVLHRDLKPGNIMVGKYGETLVVDWGLARVMGGTGEAVDDDQHGPIDRNSLSGSAQTIHGHAIGTPGYMSPEQADGRHDELGPESDVYSLGATLYFVLTGQGPFSGETSLERLYERIRRGDYPPPRSINPEVPRALDAICRKAMSVSPSDRYPTPRALADDIEHHLADEPVNAAPDTNLDRLLRWTRKHRQATVSAAASLILVATVATVASFLVDSARRSELREKDNARLALQETRAANAKAEAALAEATKARAQADENFKKARETVDDFLTAVSESQELQLLPDTQAFRKTLLEKARVYYQGFLKDHSSDLSLRQETVDATARLARLVMEIGSKEEAIPLFTEAVRLIEPLATANPGVAGYQERLAGNLVGLANLQANTGRRADAERNLARCVAIREALARANPDVAGYQLSLAIDLGNLAAFQSVTRYKAESEGTYLRAITALEKLAREHPGNADYRSYLAHNLGNLATRQLAAGRPADAEATSARAIAIYETLIRDNPKVVAYQAGLAGNLNHLAGYQGVVGHKVESERSRVRAVSIYEALVRGNPKVVAYQAGLASSRGGLAAIQSAAGQNEEADRNFVNAVAVYETLVRDDPREVFHQVGLALYLMNHAILQSGTGRKAAAEATYTRAIAVYETLRRSEPKVARHPDHLALCLDNLARLQAATGRTDEAATNLARAVELLERLASENPKVTTYQHRLAKTLGDLANLRATAGRTAEAEATYTRVIAVYEDLVRRHPENLDYKVAAARNQTARGIQLWSVGREREEEAAHARAVAIYETVIRQTPHSPLYRAECGLSLTHLGNSRRQPHRRSEAIATYRKGQALLTQAITAEPENLPIRGWLSYLYWHLARVLRDDGQPLEAMETTRKRARLSVNNPTELYNVCPEFALCVPLLSGTEAERAAIEVVESLQRAVDAGWSNATPLAREAAFAPIRHRKDFQAILQSLQDRVFPADPFAK